MLAPPGEPLVGGKAVDGSFDGEQASRSHLLDRVFAAAPRVRMLSHRRYRRSLTLRRFAMLGVLLNSRGRANRHRAAMYAPRPFVASQMRTAPDDALFTDKEMTTDKVETRRISRSYHPAVESWAASLI